MKTLKWRLRLGAEAERDFSRILAHTHATYGPRQADLYRTVLADALAALGAGPDVPGSSARDELHPGVRTLHVARRGKRGRHFIIYRAVEGRVIEIVRILHDAMDLARHIPPDLE